jgi:NAD(P)-dependent dehydrogenase (short-subunit alcohol dehydrogenase family)
MKVEQGQTAFITGGGRGIGRALAIALASRGVQVTIIDVQTAQGEESVRLVEEEHARISYKPTNSPSAIFIRCDVTKSDELAAAYARHQDVFGRLHICINNAGVLSVKPFYEDADWRKMIDVNLTAVIDGTSKAIQAMKEKGGLILNLASSASFMPVEFLSVYCASKAGVAMFTRSLANIGMGIRVNALCPEFVETTFLDTMPVALMDFVRDHMGFVTMDKLVQGAFFLLDDESMTGECMWVPVSRPTQIWPDEETKKKYQPITKDGLAFTGSAN